MADTEIFTTRILPFDEATLAEAAALVLAGMPVAVPTETVYGLAADATNGEAVARIYAAKGRPRFNPLIVHVAGVAAADMIAELDGEARRLAERFWPGPLTLVVPHRATSAVASIVAAGLPTIAIRAPAHPVMQALLAACGRPLAAPSANASGRISPTRAEHVAASLGGRIPLIVDGGATGVGIESTIVVVEQGEVRLLRSGPLGAAELGLELAPAEPDRLQAPGQLQSHYAPAKPLRLNAVSAGADEWLIGFGDIEGHATLSGSGDLVEAAANLFALLHEADAQLQRSIAVAPIPNIGLGAAINDRLSRAAAAGG
jgi:L-threonylcarbamoyladenylate synthase